MTLRPCTPQDLDTVLTLFYQSVHGAAKNCYTPRQLSAWAPKKPNRQHWQDILSGRKGHQAFLAEEGGIPVGFATLCARENLLDHLYVSPDFQRRGAARLLTNHLEELALGAGCPKLWTEASLAARGFFEGQGYRVLREQQVRRRGQLLTNFVMEKIL